MQALKEAQRPMFVVEETQKKWSYKKKSKTHTRILGISTKSAFVHTWQERQDGTLIGKVLSGTDGHSDQWSACQRGPSWGAMGGEVETMQCQV